MPPIPCSHCGNNFMRPTIDPEAPKLCNNCAIREEKRTSKGDIAMQELDILVRCPQDVYAKIEEICVSEGTNPSKYFMSLHDANVQKRCIRDGEKIQADDLDKIQQKIKQSKK